MEIYDGIFSPILAQNVDIRFSLISVYKSFLVCQPSIVEWCKVLIHKLCFLAVKYNVVLFRYNEHCREILMSPNSSNSIEMYAI